MPSYELCARSVPVTALIRLPPGSTAFSSAVGRRPASVPSLPWQVAHEGVGKEVGNEKGLGQTRRVRIRVSQAAAVPAAQPVSDSERPGGGIGRCRCHWHCQWQWQCQCGSGAQGARVCSGAAGMTRSGWAKI